MYTTSSSPSTSITVISSNSSQVYSTSYSSALTTTHSHIIGRRIGFWIQEHGGFNPYTPQQFFDQYFMQPPYPSSLEVMIFSTIPRGGSLSASISFWSQVASLADQYPNIEITPMLAFGTNTSGPSLQNWPEVQQWINALSPYSSIYSFGIEGEFSTQLNVSDYSTVASFIHNTGKQFISYYLKGTKLTTAEGLGGYYIGQSNFPDCYAGCYQANELNFFTDQYSVGGSWGVYFPAQFPGGISCPIGPNELNTTNYGYNQCVIDTLISASVSLPLEVRQFVNLDVGQSYPQYSSFTDCAGVQTSEMWDNPIIRNWIWYNANYTTNFLLSTNMSSPIG